MFDEQDKDNTINLGRCTVFCILNQGWTCLWKPRNIFVSIDVAKEYHLDYFSQNPNRHRRGGWVEDLPFCKNA